MQAELEGNNYRIAVARKDFNDAVQTFNTVKRFPTVLIAGTMGFQTKAYFQSDQGAQNAPQVNFDFSGTTPRPLHIHSADPRLTGHSRTADALRLPADSSFPRRGLREPSAKSAARLPFISRACPALIIQRLMIPCPNERQPA